MVNKNAVSTSLALTSWEIFGARMGSGWATTTTTISAIRLERIRVDPFAPEFAKPHPKQESIWARQYADGFVKAPLDDYPTPELVVDTLRDGLSTAQDLDYGSQ